LSPQGARPRTQLLLLLLWVTVFSPVVVVVVEAPPSLPAGAAFAAEAVVLARRPLAEALVVATVAVATTPAAPCALVGPVIVAVLTARAARLVRALATELVVAVGVLGPPAASSAAASGHSALTSLPQHQPTQQRASTGTQST
jgi:hypothetical protein